MNILEYVKKVENNEIDVVDYVSKALDECEQLNPKYHYLNTISRELALIQAKQIANSKQKGALLGMPLSVKDNICVKGVESTAGSAVLKGYKPLFHATVVQQLIDQGAVVIGKNSQDEFGFGGFNVNVGVGFPLPLHPDDDSRVPGGSSGGSAGLTKKATFAHASLGESTGGSIETPAAYCGVVGMCSTYGAVSRYGLIDYGNSLDKVGPMTKTIAENEFVWKHMIGKDPKDSTSVSHPLPKVDIKKVGVIRALANVASPEVKQSFEDAVKRLSNAGVEVVDVDLPVTFEYAMQTYYILGLSEASTNLAKYCGMRYGKTEKLQGMFNEYFTTIRSKYLGEEAKRRIILGTFARMAGYRDAFYIQAAKVRRKIIGEYKTHFADCQAIISPTNPLLAPTFEQMAKMSVLDMYNIDSSTVGPNLSGMPHLSVPIGTQKNLPVGAMVISDHFHEQAMFDVAKLIEKQ